MRFSGIRLSSVFDNGFDCFFDGGILLHSPPNIYFANIITVSFSAILYYENPMLLTLENPF